MFSVRNRITKEIVFGPYMTKSSANRSFRNHSLQLKDFVIADEDWRDREAIRPNLIDLSVVNLTPITDHFLHVSARSEDVGELLVSYTESPEKGMEDRQVAGTKIGRYLKAFYPDLTSDQVTEYAAKISTRYMRFQLHFTSDPDEIVRVYRDRTNANSCMSYSSSDYSNKLQGRYPVEAYGNSPDVQLAYLTRRGSSEVLARTLVWPEKKTWSRLYGDHIRLGALLTAQGYREELYSFRGARLQKIETYRNESTIWYACPYTDGTQDITITDEYLVIGMRDGGLEYTCSSTQGTISVRFFECFISKKTIIGSRDYVEIYDAAGKIRRISREFNTPEYVDSFEGYNYLKSENPSDYTVLGCGTKVPRYYAANYCTTCHHDGKLYKLSQTRRIQREYYWVGNLPKALVVCPYSQEMLKANDAIQMHDGTIMAPSIFVQIGKHHNGQNYLINDPIFTQMNELEAA